MLKFGLALACALLVTEAKFNKYERLQEVFETIKNDETLLKMYRDHERQFIRAREKRETTERETRSLHPFHCDNDYVPTLTPPTSGIFIGFNLRPEHINVVGAIGDSITAGNGLLATSIFDVLVSYRGRSWSIGGDMNFERHVQTLPNMLKKFNSNLKGFSVGKCDTSNITCSQLNVAVTGETSTDLPRQARELIERMKNQTFGVDFDRDWKLVTVFIGANDLCDFCHDIYKYSPSNFGAKVREALDILHSELPRTFVNLVQIMDLSQVAQVSTGFFCNFVHNMVCDCVQDTQNLKMISQTSRIYQYELQQLVDSGRYDTKDDFTVVLQPFFRDMQPIKDSNGKNDLSYFAPDCFHFSDLGGYAAAKSLWNNMLEPVGSKQTVWHLEQFHCPGNVSATGAVFRTAKN